MWDKNIDETNTFQFDCDECNGNYQLPPPKFHIPPPPIPPSLKIQCNKDDLINRINNWDNDMCDAIPTFDASFYSSPFVHTLILVAVFSLILILVIILSVIYVRRLIKQKNGGCKELKNLVKHHLNKTNSSNLEKLQTTTTPTDNYYEECYHCNEYTISRQAKDFIGYTITTEGHQQQRTSDTILAATGTTRISRPSIQNSLLFNTEHYFGYNNNINRQNLNQYSIYNDISGYFNEPINQNNHHNLNQNYNHYFNNQNINLNNQYYNNRQFEYSRTYDDFIELNNSTSPSTTTTDDCSGIDSTSNNNYPEYIDIELAIPNL